MPFSKKDILIIIPLSILYSSIAIYFYSMSPLEVGWDYYSWKNIAIKYGDGYFKEALNAYWSPLVSWLMIPLVKMNLFEGKENLVINLVAGLPLLLLSFKITNENNIIGFPKMLFILAFFLFAIGLPVLFYDFCDFLAAVVFIAYVTFITSSKLVLNKNYYWISGGLAVLCTFAKSFYTSYVLLSIVLLLAYYYFFQRNSEGYRIKNLYKSLIMVCIAVFVWGGLLSWKYNKLILNSSGAYNFNIASPDGFKPHYLNYGLFPPPDAHSYYNWVDPTYYPIQKRKVFSDWESVKYQWGVLKFNFPVIIYTFSFFSYLKVFVLLLIIPVFYIRDRVIKERLFFFYLSSLIVMGGYFLVLIEERYFLGVQLLFFIFSYIAIYKFFDTLNFNRYSKVIMSISLILVFLSFMKINYFSIREWLNEKNVGNKKHIEKMVLYEKKIAQLPFIRNKKIATAYSHNELDDLTCFEIWKEANTINYGNLGKWDSYEEQYQDLKKYDIDYFLYYGCSKTDEFNNCINTEPPFYIKNRVPVYNDTIYGVKIYAMKPY